MSRPVFTPFFAHLVRTVAIAVWPLVTLACAAAAPTGPSSAGTASSPAVANVDASVSFCAEEINRYRARAGVGPLERSSELDGFSARAAEYDARARAPHQYFKMTNGGGIATAENQLLLWKGYAVNDVIRQGLAQMWAEGPGGSHYQIMLGNYGQVGCGVFMSGNEVSISQDFR